MVNPRLLVRLKPHFISEPCRFVTTNPTCTTASTSGINNFGFGTHIADSSSLSRRLCTSKKATNDAIPGTVIFDGNRAMAGYALNKMCFSFNSAENREAYLRNADAYCDKFNVTAQQRRALKHRNVLELLEAGGNIYYLAKWAGIFGLNVQQIGAQQRGMTEDEFKDLLVRAGKD